MAQEAVKRGSGGGVRGRRKARREEADLATTLPRHLPSRERAACVLGAARLLTRASRRYSAARSRLTLSLGRLTPHASLLTPPVNFVVVIPARFASTRLHGKALVDIAGKPMVVHVAQRAQASGAAEVWIATDDERIMTAAQAHGCQALMTRADHASGTDRIAEVAALRGWAEERIVVNVQGDEPRIAPALIRDVARGARAPAPRRPCPRPAIRCTTPATCSIPTWSRWCSTARGDALYFSRATIPWARDAFAADRTRVPDGLPVYRHIGIYGYRCRFLRQYPSHEPAAHRALRGARAAARALARPSHRGRRHRRCTRGRRGYAGGPGTRAAAVRCRALKTTAHAV